MSVARLYLMFISLCVLRIGSLEASYQCGIRKYSFIQLVHRGWEAEEGQWPWHVAVFHKLANGTSQYACGGTLIDQTHVLTAAHCAVNLETGYPLPKSKIELHFGQRNLSKITDHTQIRDVSMVHVHHEHSEKRNDIAVLVTRLAVEYTDFVIPICLDQRENSNENHLEGQRGWTAGWGTTHIGNLSDVLWSASMPVVSYLNCSTNDPILFGNILNPKVFCAGDRNGTSPGTGDSGGGMYFSEGDRWVLGGIVSFGKLNELNKEVDTSKYTVFVKVQEYLSWIRDIMDETNPQAKGPLRISKLECDRFQSYAEKNANGLCANSRNPHTVSIVFRDVDSQCTGVLVNENHVLTTCSCGWYDKQRGPTKVRFNNFGEKKVQKMTCHPQFGDRYFYHDLAIIKLDSSINLASDLIPACLASNWTENLYDTLLLTSYGSTPFSGFNNYFKSDENRIINKKVCDQYLLETSVLPEGKIPNQLCVMNYNRMRNRTLVASGSPLQSVSSRTCMHTIVGVTSIALWYYGVRVQNLTVVDIYTRVSHYLDWIEEIVWDMKPEDYQ